MINYWMNLMTYENEANVDKCLKVWYTYRHKCEDINHAYLCNNVEI